MQGHKNLYRALGVAMLAMMFGTASVYAQSGAGSASGTTDPTTGSAASGTTGPTTGSATSGAADTAPGSAASGSSAAEQSGAGSSAAGTTAAGADAKALSKADQNMMRDMAYANLAEIEAGKIALERSKNDQVRTYAQKMIDDHTQAQKDLEQLAQAKGVTLPTEPDNKHKAAAKKLSALEGDKFDKQYMAQGGLSDHRNTHRLLERAQQRASDPELKSLAAKMAPIVSQHLTMAQDLQSGKAGASGSSGQESGTSGASGASGTSGPSDTSPGK